MSRPAWGAGFTTETPVGEVLDTWYRWLGWGEYTGGDFDDLLTGANRADERRGVQVRAARVTIDVDEAPASASDAYLRLHLLSHRLATPNSLNMDGIFGALANVAWTNLGPVSVDRVDDIRFAEARDGRRLTVLGQDKFPRMLDYVSPSGVRIADADRVRLGAHLAEGTVVMHEGFCNFNAGTLGTSMVEGRISAGVVVGDGSDIGGGASIMGTLSGGGKETISVGRNCLIGANAGLGISLGDDCIVEAGLYLTAGTLVKLPDGDIVKGRQVSGASGMMFIRHSQTGAVEARVRSGAWGGLNEALHTN
ncbi:MAG: 2,3,4,5-tetrahydropyridine-2,6-dicarboxylate N-succinyltransferase [Acidimicrobiia bacterium]|jgi:2,3,4,5-tetrahydropyridine-2-carboxylate N-succinyltransferase|nr:2,3,4,5-tetrahydropyridine-2,6-dicarboxylate N-succinyltransferase [Acidimicrobiia bacterium]